MSEQRPAAAQGPEELGLGELELLFERYRRAGDLAALGAVFDRTAPGLLALAVHLVRDPVEAEDLVQTTFVAAIEGARSFDRERRLKPWLAGILARQAARHFRDRSRRPDAARLPTGEVPDPAREAEAREVAAEVRRALATLGEPYRSVLEQHLVHGRRALDIARGSGRAPGAVRMQILRGLERLRRLLPASLYSVFPAARVPRGLAALRVEVLTRGELAAGVGSAVLASSILGALSMSKVLVSLALAAALGALFLWDPSREPGPPSEQRRSELDTGAKVAEPLAPPAAESSVAIASEREALAPAIEASSKGLRANVTPAAEERGVYLTGRLDGLGDEDPRETTIAVTCLGSDASAGGEGSADGSYAVDLTQIVESPSGVPHTVYVTATHPSYRKASVEFALPSAPIRASSDERVELRLDLDLSPRAAIVGRVAASHGAAPDSALVAIGRPGRESAEAGESGGFEGIAKEVNCDEHGDFVLYPEELGEFLVIAHAWGFRPALETLVVLPGEVVDVGTLVLGREGAAIEGVLALAFDAAASDFDVRATRVVADDEMVDCDWRGLGFRGANVEVLEQVAEVASDGSFRIEGLAPGFHRLSLEGERSRCVVLSSNRENELVVSAPAVGVRVGEHHGRVRVRIRVPEDGPTSADLCCSRAGAVWEREVSVDGPVDVIADRRETVTFVVEAAGCAREERELEPVRPAEQEFVLDLGPDVEHAALELEWDATQALGPSAVPSAIRARFRSDDRDETFSASTQGGTSRFEKLTPGHFLVTLEPRTGMWMPLASTVYCEDFEVDLVEGRTTRAPVRWLSGGRARFVPGDVARDRGDEDVAARVVDAWERPVAVSFVTRGYSDGVITIGTRTDALPRGEPSELEPNLAPGAYALLLGEGETLARVPFTIRAGEVVEVALPHH